MIKKLTLIGVMAILCFFNKGAAQSLQIVPFQIGERVPDLPLKNIINYKDSATTLSSFGNKLIILDFWNTYCTNCIQMFPKEDSLQAMFPNDIQFILITDHSKEKVETFLKKYNKTQKNPLSLPVIVADHLMKKMFRFSYIPHYVWIAPNGQILGETSDSFISKENITKVLIPIRAEEKRLQGNPYADFNLHLQKPDKNIIEFLKLIDN